MIDETKYDGVRMNDGWKMQRSFGLDIVRIEEECGLLRQMRHLIRLLTLQGGIVVDR